MQARRFLRRLTKDVSHKDLPDLGAMLAYYAVLALFPMLLLVLSLAMLVLDPSTVREGLGLATTAMPDSVRELISTRVESLIASSRAGFAIVGAALALWGASRGVLGMMSALNRIDEQVEKRPWLRRQLLAIGVTLAVAILSVLALGLLVVGPAIGHATADRFGFGAAFDSAWSWGRWLGAGVLVWGVIAILYRFLPNKPFAVITPGAIVAVIGWLGMSALFGLYLRYFNSYEVTYGAVGGAIIFLTWLWLSNIALLFGAEVNHLLRAHETPAQTEPGMTVPAPGLA